MVASANLATASGLQIAPVTLTLQATQNADGIWLSNAGENVLNARFGFFAGVKVLDIKLSPSQGLVISPPMLALAPGERQLIRVIRTSPPSAHAEDAYRLSIDELPPAKVEKNKLQFVLHYSVPVFIQPTSAAQTQAKLQWKLQQLDGKKFIEVSNQGNGHAQLSAATFISPDGTKKVITPGLLGYVLPGSTMRWIVSVGQSLWRKIEVTMAKKQYKICNRFWLLVKYCFLNGVLISGMVCAQTLNNNQSENGVINSTSQITGSRFVSRCHLNGNPVGLVHFGYDNGKLYAGANTLSKMGFRFAPDATNAVCLNDIPQLTIDYNVQLQTLSLTAPLSSLDLATTQLNSPTETAPTATTSRGRCSIMISIPNRGMRAQ
jgi:fimbrial chaperone protein